jgi:nucleoside-diphosphate-sugar epimerase
MLQTCARTWFDTPFGSETFLRALREVSPFDVLCHHWADRRGSGAPTFDLDPVVALQANTQRLVDILRTMKDAGCGLMVLTGSVFEEGEGSGDLPLRARNAFDLSKGLTSAVCDFYCKQERIALDRFVIANPFGPYEERGLANYLMQTWFAGKTAHVSEPRYVRDNIHVRELASCYAHFVSESGPRGGRKMSPSGYIESLGDFARRLAQETRKRTKLRCPVSFGRQNHFVESAIRVNTTMSNVDPSIDHLALWDEYIQHYETTFELLTR